MNEPILHPAASNDIPPFEGFLDFVKVGGDLENDFVSFLEQLHSLSADVWRPGACGTASFLSRSARRISIPMNQVLPKRFGFDHYWVNVVIAGKELIVDPYGVPDYGAPWESEPRLITPFFGIAELAQTSRHAKVYREAKDGHRKFIM